MTMTTSNGADAELDFLDEQTSIQRVDTSAVAVLNRSEVECQLDAAHKYPRQIKRFLKEAEGLASLSRGVAESCIYGVKRGDKIISGPSVRLAEICASAWGNLHVAARVIDAEDTQVVAQGVAWDLEKNLRASIEVRRRITDKRGRRYNEDMITVTGAAAVSIAIRNAIFRVIPRSYVDSIYKHAKLVAVGDASTLVQRRAEVVIKLQKLGVTPDRIFARVDKRGIEDVGLEELETLIGLGTAIRDNGMQIDEAFPAIDTTVEKNRELEDQIKAQNTPQQAPAQPRTKAPVRAAKPKEHTAPAQEAAAAPPAPPAAPSQPKETAGVRFDESWKNAPAEDDGEPHEREPGEEG